MKPKEQAPWYGYHITIKAKRQSRKLAAIFYRAGEESGLHGYVKRASHVYMCSDVVAVQDGKVVVQWHCRERLCPLCAIAESRKVALNARLVLDRACSDEQLKPYMLTLTQKNCNASELSERLSDMLKSWDAITHGMRKARQYVKGYARTIEITVGRDGLYHPHMHAIMLMTQDAPRDMTRARFWALLWQKGMHTQRYQGDIVPICDIRPIRSNPRKGLPSEAAAAAEVAKYTAKSASILSHAHAYEHIIAIDTAINGRKLRSYGGIWRTIRAQLKLEDAVDDSVIDSASLLDVPVDVWKWAGADVGYSLIGNTRYLKRFEGRYRACNIG